MFGLVAVHVAIWSGGFLNSYKSIYQTGSHGLQSICPSKSEKFFRYVHTYIMES